MKNPIRRSLIGAAAVSLIVGAGLASCSKPAGENATAPAATESAAAEAAPAQGAPGNDQSSANAKGLLKAMSDYLATQNNLSLAYDSIFEVVSADHQKLQIATSGTVDMDRMANKVHATRKTGFSDTETFYDGKTLTLYGKGKNAYVQADVPGTIDSVIDQLREKFHRQLPGADLLQSGVYDELMTDVTDVKDLGSGIIGGKECDHIALRSKDTDVQVWIAQGGQPYPCRYVITSKGVDQAPEFVMTVRDWKTGGGGNFTFTPPAGATKMDVADLENLKDTADLPDNYKIGAGK